MCVFIGPLIGLLLVAPLGSVTRFARCCPCRWDFARWSSCWCCCPPFFLFGFVDLIFSPDFVVMDSLRVSCVKHPLQMARSGSFPFHLSISHCSTSFLHPHALHVLSMLVMLCIDGCFGTLLSNVLGSSLMCGFVLLERCDTPESNIALAYCTSEVLDIGTVCWID